MVPSEKGILLHISEVSDTYNLIQVNDLGFEHYIYETNHLRLKKEATESANDEICKIIKYTIDHVLSI
jgi:hypothetical protein